MSFRQILRTQYIGSIVVGMLTFQGVSTIVATVTGLVTYRLEPQRPDRFNPPPAFPWQWIFGQVITVVLDIAIAYLLARWMLSDDRRFEPAETSGSDDASDLRQDETDHA